MSTWRHTLYGQCLILLIAGYAYGQWDTNAWPAYLHSRAGRIQCTNSFAALNERCDAVSASLPAAPAWYRSQRGNLIEFKIHEKAIVTSYLDNAYVFSTTFLTALNSKTNTPAYNDNWNYTLQSFYGAAKIPTNFFDYTPYRGLDGVGPFTNDASVGHPHGWTNEYTVAGGTNFPSGRTNWYTTDYGFDTFRRSVTNLCRTTYANTLNEQGGYGIQGNAYGSNWVTAKSLAQSDFANVSVNAVYYSYGNKSTSPYPDFLYAATYKSWLANLAIATSCKTNITPSSINTYFVTYDPPVSSTNFPRVELYPCTYSDFGLGYTNQGAWYSSLSTNSRTFYGWQDCLYLSNSVSSGTWRSWAGAGSTNIPGDCDEPMGDNDIVYKGFNFDANASYRVLYDFIGATNGFKYK